MKTLHRAQNTFTFFRSQLNGSNNNKALHKHIFLSGIEDVIHGHSYQCSACAESNGDDEDYNIVHGKLKWQIEKTCYQDYDGGFMRSLLHGFLLLYHFAF